MHGGIPMGYQTTLYTILYFCKHSHLKLKLNICGPTDNQYGEFRCQKLNDNKTCRYSRLFTLNAPKNMRMLCCFIQVCYLSILSISLLGLVHWHVWLPVESHWAHRWIDHYHIKPLRTDKNWDCKSTTTNSVKICVYLKSSWKSLATCPRRLSVKHNPCRSYLVHGPRAKCSRIGTIWVGKTW